VRKLSAWQYVTLDGVVEAPENWVMADERMFEQQTADYAASDALLLGRRTYEIFAASWPQRGSDVPNAEWMNNTPKYVASKTLEAPEWQNTTVLEGDVREAVSRLKQAEGATITLNGSATLLRSLLGAGLVDALRLFLHPLVLGAGNRHRRLPLPRITRRDWLRGTDQRRRPRQHAPRSRHHRPNRLGRGR
jgi:dihydrofolate reductase